jgi:hypothetical protein
MEKKSLTYKKKDIGIINKIFTYVSLTFLIIIGVGVLILLLYVVSYIAIFIVFIVMALILALSKK